MDPWNTPLKAPSHKFSEIQIFINISVVRTKLIACALLGATVFWHYLTCTVGCWGPVCVWRLKLIRSRVLVLSFRTWRFLCICFVTSACSAGSTASPWWKSALRRAPRRASPSPSPMPSSPSCPMWAPPHTITPCSCLKLSLSKSLSPSQTFQVLKLFILGGNIQNGSKFGSQTRMEAVPCWWKRGLGGCLGPVFSV